MHKIQDKEFTLDDFSTEHLINGTSKIILCGVLDLMNQYRRQYIDTNNKEYWWQMIQMLPSSYNQHRTICMSYEVVFKIIKERTGHKLDEWNELVKVLRSLPYIEEIICDGDKQ